MESPPEVAKWFVTIAILTGFLGLFACLLLYCRKLIFGKSYQRNKMKINNTSVEDFDGSEFDDRACDECGNYISDCVCPNV